MGLGREGRGMEGRRGRGVGEGWIGWVPFSLPLTLPVTSPHPLLPSLLLQLSSCPILPSTFRATSTFLHPLPFLSPPDPHALFHVQSSTTTPPSSVRTPTIHLAPSNLTDGNVRISTHPRLGKDIAFHNVAVQITDIMRCGTIATMARKEKHTSM